MNTYKIPEETLKVSGSKIFSYPTYLADAFVPASLEIEAPGYEVIQPEIAYTVKEGITDSLNTKRMKGQSLIKYNLMKTKKTLGPALKLQDFNLDNEKIIYDGRHIDQNNVAHMLINIMPPALHMKKKSDLDIVVVLEENVKSFIVKVCEVMEIPVIVTDKEIKGKIVSVANFEQCMNPDKFYQSLLPLYDEILAEEKPPEGYSRILIGRKGSRTITNQPDIEELLTAYNFKKVYFEDFSMSQQWLLGRHAEVIVGIHGAAFGALMFNRNQAKVIELFHPGYIVKSIRNITACVGGSWCGVTGKMPETYSEEKVAQNPREFATASLTVDVQSLEKALKYMGIEK